jgi:hypothetical protein
MLENVGKHYECTYIYQNTCTHTCGINPTYACTSFKRDLILQIFIKDDFPPSINPSINIAILCCGRDAKIKSFE